MSEGPAKNRFFKDRYAVSMASGTSGGMSVVYRGTDLESPGTSVAVKVFRQTLDPKESTLLAEAFKRETAALKELQHPNIVRLIDFGIDSATHETFLVLEWIERSLLDHLAASRPTSWPVFYDQVGRPLVEGLAFAHIALDGFACIAKGRRLIDGTGTHDDDVTRHLAPARAWHPDAAQRRIRAELLRELADVLEGDEAPTAETLERCIPDTFKDRLLSRSLESRTLARLRTIDLPSRSQLESMNRSAFSRWGVDRFIRAVRGIKFGAVFMLRSRHRDK